MMEVHIEGSMKLIGMSFHVRYVYSIYIQGSFMCEAKVEIGYKISQFALVYKSQAEIPPLSCLLSLFECYSCDLPRLLSKIRARPCANCQG